MDTTAVFDVDGRHWEVRVRSRPGPPHRLTCRSEREEAAPVHELLGLITLTPPDAGPGPTWQVSSPVS